MLNDEAKRIIMSQCNIGDRLQLRDGRVAEIMEFYTTSMYVRIWTTYMMLNYNQLYELLGEPEQRWTEPIESLRLYAKLLK